MPFWDLMNDSRIIMHFALYVGALIHLSMAVCVFLLDPVLLQCVTVILSLTIIGSVICFIYAFRRSYNLRRDYFSTLNTCLLNTVHGVGIISVTWMGTRERIAFWMVQWVLLSLMNIYLATLIIYLWMSSQSLPPPFLRRNGYSIHGPYFHQDPIQREGFRLDENLNPPVGLLVGQDGYPAPPWVYMNKHERWMFPSFVNLVGTEVAQYLAYEHHHTLLKFPSHLRTGRNGYMSLHWAIIRILTISLVINEILSSVGVRASNLNIEEENSTFTKLNLLLSGVSTLTWMILGACFYYILNDYMRRVWRDCKAHYRQQLAEMLMEIKENLRAEVLPPIADSISRVGQQVTNQIQSSTDQVVAEAKQTVKDSVPSLLDVAAVISALVLLRSFFLYFYNLFVEERKFESRTKDLLTNILNMASCVAVPILAIHNGWKAMDVWAQVSRYSNTIISMIQGLLVLSVFQLVRWIL